MPPFGPPESAHAHRPASDVNRFWRRQMWDTELHRLYTHLTAVTHNTNTHQNPLYLQNAFHDQARDRAAALAQAHVSQENQNLFRRLLSVHMRRPREFLTHHVANPKTHSRYLEHKRVQQENQRLVARLRNSSKTFVNERGAWDAHAQAHEEMLIRLSHNPKSCFIPGLAAKRKADQASMRTASIAQQAQAKIASPRVPLQRAMERAARIEAGEIAFDGSETDDRRSWTTQTPSGFGGAGAHSDRSPSRGSAARHARPRTGGPLYSYPLAPSSLPTDPTDPESARALSRGSPPPVLLPYGTHLVAPALLDQAQYDAIHARLQEAASASSASGPMTTEDLSEQDDAARSFAAAMAEGHIQHTMLTVPFPPPAPLDDGSEQPQPEVFYLQPHAHRPASPSHALDTAGAGTDLDAEATIDESAADGANSASTSNARAPAAAAAVREAHAIPYPFQLPPLDLPEGSPAAMAAQAQREAALAAATRRLQQWQEEEKEEAPDDTNASGGALQHRHYSRPSSRPSASPAPPGQPSHTRAHSGSGLGLPSSSSSFEPQPPQVARAASSSSSVSVSRAGRSRAQMLPSLSPSAAAAASASASSAAASASATHSAVTPWVHYATARPSVYAHATSALKGARVGASNSMATSGGGVRPAGTQRRTQQQAIEALIDLACMHEHDSGASGSGGSLSKTHKRPEPRIRPSPSAAPAPVAESKQSS